MNQVKINSQTIEFKIPKNTEKEITVASDEQKNFNNFYKLLEKILNNK